MKVGIVTDNHAGCRNDSPVFVEYTVSFFSDQFIPYLLENKINTILHLGDVFDRRKYINFNTLSQWRSRVFDKLLEHNIKMYVTVGNHDVYYKNTNEINSPFELLRYYPNIELFTEPATVQLDNLPIALAPWIPLGKEEEYIRKILEQKADILAGHLEIKGFEMHAGQVNKEHGFDASVFGNFDMVLSGHFHHKSSNGNIHYLGAPYQMTWHDYGDERGFHVLDTETRNLEFIRNPKEMFKKLYYNDESKTAEQILSLGRKIRRKGESEFSELNPFAELKDLYVKVIVEKKDKPFLYDQFLEQIYAVSPADVSIVEQTLYSEIQHEEIDGAKDTLTILKEHVDSLDLTQCDKLNALFTSLYYEALTMDVE